MLGTTLLRAGRRAALTGLALLLLSAVPGVAIGSLPAHPAPTHGCCTRVELPPAGADCGTAPCCIQKPAPRTFSVLTGGSAPAILPATSVASVEPVVPEKTSAPAAPVPHARSAPLFVLFSAFLN